MDYLPNFGRLVVLALQFVQNAFVGSWCDIVELPHRDPYVRPILVDESQRRGDGECRTRATESTPLEVTVLGDGRKIEGAGGIEKRLGEEKGRGGWTVNGFFLENRVVVGRYGRGRENLQVRTLTLSAPKPHP